MEKILIVDDEPFICENVTRILGDSGYHVFSAHDRKGARDLVEQEEIDLVLLDLNLGSENGMDALKEIKKIDPELLVIMITGYGTVETAVDSLKMGAYHYMKKPFKADALKVIVKLALQTTSLRREVRAMRQGAIDFFESIPMIGSSESLKRITSQMRDVAQHPNATVLITGESGTGKEVVAKGIHHFSPRREAPFVAVNCASIPLNLLESELFGHERGSFTDARERKPGLFETANNGTLFLDEIGEMDTAIQAKLLRVLESRSFRRVGGTRDIEIDIRVVAATNRNLQQMIAEAKFRNDLYYRLNVFPIHIPPLRERRNDIPLIAAYYLEKYSSAMSRDFQGISLEAASLLEQYEWKGNIRELKNVIEKICIMHRGPLLLPEHIEPEIGNNRIAPPKSFTLGTLTERNISLEEYINQIESEIISDAICISGGNVVKTAQMLGIPRGTLRYKMEKLKLMA